jgi:hypothetical protein
MMVDNALDTYPRLSDPGKIAPNSAKNEETVR